jgi:hypothetical protein
MVAFESFPKARILTWQILGGQAMFGVGSDRKHEVLAQYGVGISVCAAY